MHVINKRVLLNSIVQLGKKKIAASILCKIRKDRKWDLEMLPRSSRDGYVYLSSLAPRRSLAAGIFVLDDTKVAKSKATYAKLPVTNRI